jgi:hypothetical protein
MPPDETELVKAGVDAALAPVKDLLNRLLGPVADELGGLFADPVRVFRLRSSIRLLEKVKAVCEEAGIEPRAVAPKTLLPILENASLEDDEDLHDRWANLLANAAHRGTIPPAFPEILRQLTGNEAQLLDTFYDYIMTHQIPPAAHAENSLRGFPDFRQITLSYRATDTLEARLQLDNCMRLGLLSRKLGTLGVVGGPNPPVTEDSYPLALTALGITFISACRRPSKTGTVGS